MVVVVCRARFVIPCKNSLKEKRSFVQSAMKRMKSRYNLSISEIDDLDIYDLLTLGISSVSRSAKSSKLLVDESIVFLETSFGVECIEAKHEILTYSEGTPFFFDINN